VEKFMSTVRTINIALIGYGFVKTFHAPLIQSVDGLKLAVVSSRDEEKVKRDLPDVEVVATPEEAIQHPDVDLVVIASPNATHAPLATLALNAGKHVVVDKPFTLDMQEARDLIALAEEKQLCSPSSTTAAGTAISSALSRLSKARSARLNIWSRILTASARKCACAGASRTSPGAVMV
jgi:predicted dinucleotide-utilizing enzyme